MKEKVLIMAGYYVPSVKGGGPIQSIKNIVDNLSDNIDFYILAADRDLGDENPFKEVMTDEWVIVGNAKVMYVDINSLSWKKTSQIINSINFKKIYLNSFFNYKFSIVPIVLNKLGKINNRQIVLAPRGEFSPGAINLKKTKKSIFINIVKLLRLYRNIIWHATAETEKKDIQLIFNKTEDIIVANNLTANYTELNYDKDIEKRKGELKVIFISRIHPKKNLKKAIEFLKYIDGKIYFNIYGPLEDQIYWSECEMLIKELPGNIKVSYKGILNHNKIMNVFKEHHIFLFPTLGENFGHVISEALIGGCPVIISDQTPWRGLEEQGVGWDIELNDENKFIEALQDCVNLSKSEYDYLSKSAFKYGKKVSNSAEDKRQSYSLFI